MGIDYANTPIGWVLQAIGVSPALLQIAAALLIIGMTIWVATEGLRNR
jgi:hypothetical protein